MQISKHILSTLLIYFTIPAFVSAQSKLFTDTANKRLVKDECDDKIFTKVEILPSINGGERALADSLSNYFKNQNLLINGQAIFVFVVAKNSQLFSIEKVSGEIDSEEIFKEGLLAYSNMWNPALQNSNKVCAVVRLRTKFKKGLISFKIIQ